MNDLSVPASTAADIVSSSVPSTVGDVSSSISVSSDAGFMLKPFSSYSTTEFLLLLIACGMFILCLLKVFKGK